MIVNSIPEFEKYFPNSTYKNFEKLATFLQQSEEKYLVHVLGNPLYKELLNKQKEVTDEPVWLRLIDLSQAIVCYFAIHDNLHILNVTLNQFGSLSVTQNDRTTAASKERTDKLEESLRIKAWDYVEQIILFLEQNSKSMTDAEGKELWAQSEWYKQLTGSLIFTAAEFNDIIYINNSRVKFRQLYPAIKKVERLKLYPIFGKQLINNLISRKMKKELTETDESVLSSLQTALALLVIPEDEELSKPDSIHGYKPFEANFAAQQEIIIARKLIEANPDAYPEYPGNQAGHEKVEPFRNSDDNSIFFLGGTTL